MSKEEKELKKQIEALPKGNKDFNYYKLMRKYELLTGSKRLKKSEESEEIENKETKIVELNTEAVDPVELVDTSKFEESINDLEKETEEEVKEEIKVTLDKEEVKEEISKLKEEKTKKKASPSKSKKESK